MLVRLNGLSFHPMHIVSVIDNGDECSVTVATGEVFDVQQTTKDFSDLWEVALEWWSARPPASVQPSNAMSSLLERVSRESGT